MKIEGNLVDLHLREIYPATITIENGEIYSISRSEKLYKRYILPGFIDSHIHIESSMVTPGAFATTAVRHGTIGTVSDPHEIANILGVEGVDYMINDGRKVPFYFWFGAPSCVPATAFETSGATIGVDETKKLMERKEIKYLSEMMNFPGVILGDKVVKRKIYCANRTYKPIDGHAPGLKGDQLRTYISAGISTDHECSTIGEAEEKINLGMKILIREGSAARNLEALKPLIKKFPDMVMLCSDDLHPETLIKRHINRIAAQLIKDEFNIFDVLRCCSVNPVKHYNLEAGLLEVGDAADFIITSDLEAMEINETWIRGQKVYDGKEVLFTYEKGEAVNKFNCSEISEKTIEVLNRGGEIKVIQAFDDELLTDKFIVRDTGGKYVESDISGDILKIVVKDRYNDNPPAVGFIRGFGLKHGAFASSVAHDSHNIICVGVSDTDIVHSVNEIVKMKGGLAVCSSGQCDSLELRIGGIMSDSPCEDIAHKYEDLSEKVRNLGCSLSAPFMTLSFMALLVIPSLKMSDRGLFDVNTFAFTSLFEK